MFTQTLVKMLVSNWLKQFSLAKLKEFASTPKPDFKTNFPIIGGMIFVWLTFPNAAPPDPRANRLARLTLKGESFWVWWARTK